MKRSLILRVLTVALVTAINVPANAQESITGVLTDFNGFYESYEGNISATRPNSAHNMLGFEQAGLIYSTGCLLYTSPSPRDGLLSRMPSSA